MSGKAKPDRRIVQTRGVLGDALMSLMQQKTFDEITVQQVLDKAGVSRSAFYAHYSDKDDLFLSDVEDFFEMMGTLLTRRNADSRRVAPVTELFGHIAESRHFYNSFLASGKLKDVFEMGQGILARSILERLRLKCIPKQPEPLAAYAHGLAGSLFALLDWWLAHGTTPTAQEMDAIFHRMVWSGLIGQGVAIKDTGENC